MFTLKLLRVITENKLSIFGGNTVGEFLSVLALLKIRGNGENRG